MRKFYLVLSLAMFSLFGKATLYVVPGGAGTADGSSWANAYSDIQTAINAASTLYGTSATVQEVWVKAGSYSTSTAALIMKESVSVYGGFAGTETDKTQRAKGTNAWNYTNVTTLNGGATKRCIEVAADLINVTVIDGFTITNGNGVGAQLSGSGGGVVLRGNLKLQNCIVTGNTTTGNGGAINATGGLISNCWIYSNTTTSATIPSAGGIYSSISTTTTIDNCLIERNSMGGVRFQGTGTATMDRCIIRNNTSTGNGAAIYTNNAPNVTITNSLITNNTGGNNIYLNKGKVINSTIANNEGGIYLASATNIGELYNNIIVNNVSKGTTTATSVSVVTSYPTGKVKNNAIWPSVAYQAWGGATDSILTTNTATAFSQVSFKSPTSFIGRVLSNADSLNMISSADWNINNGTLCINKGDNSLIPSGISTDFAGLSRTQGSAVDAGAYELPYYTTAVTFTAGGTVNSYTSGDIDSKPQGTQLAFTITPTAGYKITTVLYNGTNVTASLVSNAYTAPVLEGNSTLVVQFDIDLGTGLQNTKAGVNCFSVDQRIELTCVTPNTEISIFSMTGAKIKSEKINSSNVSIFLPQGIYMVKVANQVKKVVVR
jgi:hypothetical protein